MYVTNFKTSYLLYFYFVHMFSVLFDLFLKLKICSNYFVNCLNKLDLSSKQFAIFPYVFQPNVPP